MRIGNVSVFQSPRSGKFISNLQVKETFFQRFLSGNLCFNPLDRGNLYLIAFFEVQPECPAMRFQSPRSGKFASNMMKHRGRRK